MDGDSMASVVAEGARVVVAFEVVDHGSEHEQFFQGCGIAFTEFEECATGTGTTAREAFDDALEGLASGGWDVSNIPETDAPTGEVSKVACDACGGDAQADTEGGPTETCAVCDGEGMFYPDGTHYYVSVRVRGPKERIEAFRARALAEAKRGKAARLAGQIPNAVLHERNVDLTLTSAEHEIGRSGRLEIEDALADVELSM